MDIRNSSSSGTVSREYNSGLTKLHTIFNFKTTKGPSLSVHNNMIDLLREGNVDSCMKVLTATRNDYICQGVTLS